MPDRGPPFERPAVMPIPPRPVRPLTIDAVKVVESVLRRATAILSDMDRGAWMDGRLQRYAKYRGWLEEKTFPWRHCSNVHIGLMQIAELRANAGLHNVVMTMRPLVTARATGRSGVSKEERITELIDTQLFLDPGPDHAERVFGDYVSSFLQDSNVVAFTPWVRDERTVTTVKYRPRVPAGDDPADYVLRMIAGDPGRNGQPPSPGLVPAVSAIVPTGAWEYEVAYQVGARERVARCQVFEGRDEGLEFVFRHDATIFDGPVMIPLPIDAVLVPTRCANLQPPSGFNQEGAPHVFVLVRYTIDEIRRLHASGEFNLLTAEGLKQIITQAKVGAGVGSGKSEEALQEQKDQLEGRDHRPVDPQVEDEVGHLSVDCYMAFDRWDVDGDTFAEDVYWLIARDAKVLCEARLLTDKWPVDPDEPPYRPLAEACAIPVPHRYYGISLLELGEALQDLVKGTFDQAYDAATISNMPFFLYSSQAGWRGDTLTIEPGRGNPVPGDPRATAYFPNLPGQNQTFAFSVIGLAMSLFQQELGIGELQQGRVPTGKASALRTFGTTAAILQQGDVRADQLLLRLFSGLRQVAINFHRMNRHLLPEGKEIRRLGYDGPQADGYVTIQTIDEIDAAVRFDFRPDFLLSNPAMLAQTLERAMQLVVTPMAVQAGITDLPLIYNLIRDGLKALRLDPKRYSKPPREEGLPRILAEEFIDALLDGLFLDGIPLEGAEGHLKKLFAFRADKTKWELLQRSPEQVELFRVHLERVARLAQTERLSAAAGQFQLAQTQGGAGTQGVETSIREPDLAAGTGNGATPAPVPVEAA